MNRKRAAASAVAVLLAAAGAGAIASAGERSPAAVVTGVWLGRSSCEAVEGAPECAAGEVRCEFRLDAAPEGEFVRLEMTPIGSGGDSAVERFDLDYLPESWSWTAEVREGGFHGRWSWRISEFILHGTLTDLETNRVVRRVSAEREPASKGGSRDG